MAYSAYMTLIIDTAHPTARIILVEGDTVAGVREWANTPRVGVELLIYIQEVLDEAGLEMASVTRIAVHAGPGSYALLRTGIVSATILAQTLGAQLVGISGDTVDEYVENSRLASPVASIEVKYASASTPHAGEK